MIKFQAENHSYTSIVPDNRTWTSITSVVGMLHEPFDRIAKAQSCSTRKPGKYPNKWYGLTPQQILDAWDGEGKRSVELGHWYHDKREQTLYTGTQELDVHAPHTDSDTKFASDQRLTDGIYPEHIVYLDTAGICGQSDYVKVQMNRLYIRDYKTSKEIKRKGFENWEGEKMMLGPVQHLGDCEFYHYAIQLSLYAYCILKHNPHLKLQELVIEHIKFEVESEDKHGYPVYRRDSNGEFIVREIEEIQLPYLAKECQAIINWLKRK